MATNQKLQLSPFVLSSQKTPKGSLLANSVTSSQIFDLLTPQFFDEYISRDLILKEFPLISSLLKYKFPKDSLVSMLKCGKKSSSGVKITCGCGSVYKEFSHHCSNRSCPPCAKIRQKRIVKHFLPLLHNLISTPQNSIKFLTISPPNYMNFEEGQLHLRKSLAKASRRGGR